MASILSDRMFQKYCSILKVSNLVPSDPDKRVIEKAFRKAALKTHPDKPGGDAVEFRRVNDAYNRLIAHATHLEVIEAEEELKQTASVIIEISHQSVPAWIDRLRLTYGRPKCSNIRSAIFEGPCKQFKGRNGNAGPITIVLYEDPEDSVPKLHVRCQNYTIWMKEQNSFPLHLHVAKNRRIMFDQWRIMSMAEFGFCKVRHGTSARHDWKSSSEARAAKADEAAEAAREAQRQKEAEELKKRMAEEEEEEELRRRQAEEEEQRRRHHQPWWMKHSGGITNWHWGEMTPPPEDVPIYNPSTNSYTFECTDKAVSEANELLKQPKEFLAKAKTEVDLPVIEPELQEMNAASTSPPSIDSATDPDVKEMTMKARKSPREVKRRSNHRRVEPDATSNRRSRSLAKDGSGGLRSSSLVRANISRYESMSDLEDKKQPRRRPRGCSSHQQQQSETLQRSGSVKNLAGLFGGQQSHEDKQTKDDKDELLQRSKTHDPFLGTRLHVVSYVNKVIAHLSFESTILARATADVHRLDLLEPINTNTSQASLDLAPDVTSTDNDDGLDVVVTHILLEILASVGRRDEVQAILIDLINDVVGVSSRMNAKGSNWTLFKDDS